MLSVEKQILYLMSRTDEMSADELISIYQKRQYSDQYIRNVLFSLKKQGYIESPKRSSYRIRASGREYVRAINQKPLLYNREWDGTWYALLFNIPEKDRRKRNQLRSRMSQTGFGLLYPNVFVSPWNHKKEVEEFIQQLEITGYVSLLYGQMLLGGVAKEKVPQLWELDKLARVYEEKRRWFQDEFLIEAEPLSAKSDAEIFNYFLTVGEVIAELYLLDPMLPKSLLPDHWQGARILLELQQYLNRISVHFSPSSAYYRFMDFSNA
ncbi:phenylacetic acid degradation operon negative regulatory protein [Paenibacillus forsythiae]|uniref:Phenylacetic acid degradation operon negative regulatory protein n=1 Tax=Paenibacillus forsythiae TaxID=365616 RepID=A0ABU3HAA4_9BACL|nr:PaaX family transcriptional regulator C-terminal domain-containing protein [Paenibacillus forsythiae]MDT3427396.1 phenylacetic acid degradation operon negative regulatory protein [Paenibacillus forsythiae]